MPPLHPIIAQHKGEIKLWLVHVSLCLFVLDGVGTFILVHVIGEEHFYASCGKLGAVLSTIACYLEEA